LTTPGTVPRTEVERVAPPSATLPVVVVVGNPNVGKTSLFNHLTGQNARIGNYPGVTVERRSGTVQVGSHAVELVDVPGAYSLAARSAEEQIALEAILGTSGNPRPSLCVVVVDAGQIARNLYLVVQLLELGIPVIVAVNMIDEVRESPPNLEALSRALGVPCVPTDGRRGVGLPALRDAIARALREPPSSVPAIRYPKDLLSDLDGIRAALPEEWTSGAAREQALALWALSSIEQHDELEGIPDALRRRCLETRERAAGAGRDLDLEIVGSRYAFVDRILPELYERVEPHPPKRKVSERIDRVLLHPILGFVAFIAVMLVVFQALFSWSEPMIGWIEAGFGWIAALLTEHLPEGLVRDFLVQGVIGGVGNVVVFLPQILLLFFFIGLLEDSGYMARIAYLMDRVMKALGLHGRAFVPMLSGFACAVPAILATRTMEQKRDRLLTMMVIPLMTCSARLPVYSLIIAALFPPTTVLGGLPLQATLMVSMYVFSLLTTLVATGVLGRTVIRGRRIPLLLELPPYRMPNLLGTLRLMRERAFVFLREAGTVILACTVVLWALLSFPKLPESADAATPSVAAVEAPSAAATAASPVPAEVTPIEHSIAGRIGKAIEPAIEPLGFDWKLGIGIIGAFAAREVFVSTMGLVFGLEELDDEAVPLRERMRAEVNAGGKPTYTPLVGLSLMVFFALSCQCMSTLAVVRRETRSLRWPLFMFAYMTGLAYLSSLLVYQGGRLLGL